MKQRILLLAALLAAHAAPAQLLKNLKDKAAGAVQSATGLSTGGSASGAAGGTAASVLARPSIFFDSTPPPAGTKPQRTSYATTDNIYATVALPGTVGDLVKQLELEPSPEDGKLYLPVSIWTQDTGGRGYESTSVVLAPEDLTQKTLTLDILPAPGKARTPYRLTTGDARPLSAVFLSVGGPYIDYGPHTYKVVVGPNDNYFGLFELNIPNKAAAQALSQRIDADGKLLDRGLARATTLPAVFKQPQGKFADPALSDAALRKLLGPDLIRYVIVPGSTDYTVVHNDLGIPLRKVSRDVWAIYKDEDGMCVYTRLQLVRQHEGGGKYGPLTRLQHVQDNVVIACENVK